MLSYDSHIFSSQAIKRATHTHVIFPSEQARYSHTCACNLTYNKQALYSHTCACNLTHKLPRPRSRRRLSLVRASLLEFIGKNACKRHPGSTRALFARAARDHRTKILPRGTPGGMLPRGTPTLLAPFSRERWASHLFCPPVDQADMN